MKRFAALLLIVPTGSIRLSPHKEFGDARLDRPGSPLTSTTPEALCKDPEILVHACDTLAQSKSNGRVSGLQIRDYFVADASSVEDFAETIGIPINDESVSCHDLCTYTLRYVPDVLGWPLPYFTNRHCTLWEYKQLGNSTWLLCKKAVLVSPEAMSLLANQNDIPDDVQESLNTEAKDAVEVVDNSDGSHPTASEYLTYTVPELVLRISNLFRVFPSEPNIDVYSSSYLQLDPDFHENVDASVWDTWKAITAESRAWTDSVLQKFPRPLVKAFFGAESADEIIEVRRILAGMVKTLDNMKIKNADPHNCNGDDGLPDGTKAYVAVSRDMQGNFISSDMDGMRYVVHFCPFYWKPEIWSQPASKFGTLVHESAHHHGPTDRKFRGSIPYGVAQCLRMAYMSPGAAMSNADNFMQFVYYVNRCWGERRSSASEAPCTAALGPVSGKVYMSPTCTQDIEVGTVKIEDSSGNTLATHLNLGQLKAGHKGSFVVPAPVGAVVKFFYEVDCMIFEGTVVYGGAAVEIVPKAVLDLTQGETGSESPPPRSGHEAAVAVPTGDMYTADPSCHTACGASSVSTTSVRVRFPAIAADKCLKCEVASRMSSQQCSGVSNRTNSYVLYTKIGSQDLCCAELRCSAKVPSSPYKPGQAVMYLSQSRGVWYEATVTKVDGKGVEVDLKPGARIPMADVAQRLKPSQRADKNTKVDPCSSCPKDTTGCYASRFTAIIKKSCMDSKGYVIDEEKCVQQWGGKWCGLPRVS